MAVDANIITYERIREELKVGKSIKSAYQAGEKNAFTSILDSNLTTILTAAVLVLLWDKFGKRVCHDVNCQYFNELFNLCLWFKIVVGLWVHSGLLNKKPGWFGVKQSEIHNINDNFDTLDLPTRFDKLDFVKPQKDIFCRFRCSDCRLD